MKHSKINVFLFSAFSSNNSPPFKGVIYHWLYFGVLFDYEKDLSILKWMKIFH